MRSLEELIVEGDPGIDLLRDWAGRPDANRNVVLPPDLASRGSALQRFQVTTRSLLGAVVYETGGLLIADGRLRVFGSGSARSILRINEAIGVWNQGESPDLLLIADDTAGGLYALNGGRLRQSSLGSVFYLAADETVWMALDVGYADFIAWCLTGDLSFVFDDVDRHDVPAGMIEIDKVRSFYPFLWTREGSSGKADVRLVDADEALRLRIELLGFEAGA